MPLDAICLRAVLHELRPQLIGARIDKVQQPARDQIVLLLRGNLRLMLNAGANQPRIQLTNILRDNPAQPPMFCMLLRKHLVGARVLSIEQPDLERMVILTLQCTDEFGEISRKQLVHRVAEVSQPDAADGADGVVVHFGLCIIVHKDS